MSIILDTAQEPVSFRGELQALANDVIPATRLVAPDPNHDALTRRRTKVLTFYQS
jgi:hypothetical protein